MRFGLRGLVMMALVVYSGTVMAAGPKPDFGPNVAVFDPSMPPAAMQQEIDKVYAAQQHSEFGVQRNAFLFLPGEYHADVPVGFYTQALGMTPDSVHITGNVNSDAAE